MDAPAGLALLSLSRAEGQAILTSINRVCGRILEHDATTFSAMGLGELTTAEHYAELVELVSEVGDNNATLTHEIPVVTKNGRGILCEVSVSALRSADNLFVMSFEDVTARKTTEEELMEAFSLQQRADFIATLTHDLKTPIVGANMVLGALLEGTLGPLNDEQIAIISKLKASNQGSLKMIQNLLEVYRYASGSESLFMATTDICRIARESIDDLSPLIESKHLSIDLVIDKDSIDLYCDQYAMKRVLGNLLANSIKFTPNNGKISVGIKEDAGRVLISVSDNGGGIDPRDRYRLFRRFWQGEPGRSYATGTGLGLYFCYQVIKAHSGTITCDSTLGEGTTFTIRLYQTRS